MTFDFLKAFNAKSSDIDSLVTSLIMLAKETDDMILEVFHEESIAAIIAELEKPGSSALSEGFDQRSALEAELKCRRQYILDHIVPEALNALDVGQLEKVLAVLPKRLEEECEYDPDDALAQLHTMNRDAEIMNIATKVYNKKTQDFIKERRDRQAEQTGTREIKNNP